VAGRTKRRAGSLLSGKAKASSVAGASYKKAAGKIEDFFNL
jgi:hypothetical protein